MGPATPRKVGRQPASETSTEAGGTGERGVVSFGDTDIEYTVVRSRRRRRTIEITLDHAAGVLVAAPMATSREEIRQVVLKRAAWIVRRSTERILRPCQREFASGELLLYLGQQVQLLVEPGSGRRARISFEGQLLRVAVPASLDGEGRRAAIELAVRRWYWGQAAAHLVERVTCWAGPAGAAPRAVLVRNQKQRWGSCGPDGTLRFNWRLLMAPPSLIDYVVVHELAHLRVRNHSRTFWAEVARLMPDYQSRRSALREIGPSLTI